MLPPIPTALANFCLEIVSKVFADRLSTIVPKLISNEQRGLIPHCIYLAFEAIVSTKKKKLLISLAISSAVAMLI